MNINVEPDVGGLCRVRLPVRLDYKHKRPLVEVVEAEILSKGTIGMVWPYKVNIKRSIFPERILTCFVAKYRIVEFEFGGIMINSHFYDSKHCDKIDIKRCEKFREKGWLR